MEEQIVKNYELIKKISDTLDLSHSLKIELTEFSKKIVSCLKKVVKMTRLWIKTLYLNYLKMIIGLVIAKYLKIKKVCVLM